MHQHIQSYRPLLSDRLETDTGPSDTNVEFITESQWFPDTQESKRNPGETKVPLYLVQQRSKCTVEVNV